jgi:uncharacterized protein YecA (UPF0149 family)
VAGAGRDSLLLAQEEAAKDANVGRNDLCPCGSERKFK